MNARRIALLAAIACFPALAAEVSGVTLPDTANVDGKPLVLNGGGLRTKFGLADVYVMGLYLVSKSTDAKAIIDDQAPRRVTLVMKRDLDAATLKGAFHAGLEANVAPPDLQALKPKISELDQHLLAVGAVKKGDTLNLDFSAAGGTRITLNGRPQEAVAGADLVRALLKIWLGDHPVQDSLKKQILGD